MKVKKEVLDKLAHLARLEFHEDQTETLVRDMSRIVDWIDKLEEVNTDNVEPLISMSHEVNRWREDIPGQHLSREEAIRKAPESKDGFFKVPRVISHD